MIDGRRRRRATRGEVDTDQPIPPTRLNRLALGRRLAAHGVRADFITALGVMLAAVTAMLIGSGHLVIGAFGILAGGLMDTLDGAVAKAAGSSSRRGAFVDSVSDRVADGLIFGGLTWYLIGSTSPHEAMLPVAIFSVASVISYERAKAESLGLSARGGLMERAERLILLGIGLLFHVILLPVLIVLLVLSSLTAIGRFGRIWREASGPTPRAPRRVFVAVGVESRWRSWRETGRATRPPRPRRERQVLAARLQRALGTSGAAHKAPLRRSRSARAVQRRLERDS